MHLIRQHSRWVIINYPVVTSSGNDNTGGHEHLIGNIQAYRLLGYNTLCLCRISWPLISNLEGATCLNIVPGLAMPESGCDVPQSPDKNSKRKNFVLQVSKLVRSIRFGVLNIVYKGLITALSPAIIHQRANLRFMPSVEFYRKAIHLIELNDEFIPDIRCNGYLTIATRPAINLPQLVNPWPVPSCERFDFDQFSHKLDMIAQGQSTINILLFGIGGIESEEQVYEYLANHIWFRSKPIALHIYGAAQDGTQCDSRIVVKRRQSENSLPVDFYHAGIVFYSTRMYDDARLKLGSPTKLYKYIDWSLPILANRALISKTYLGNFDHSESVLECTTARRSFATFLTEFRNNAAVDVYAARLKDFIDRLGDTS
jgi:hypothetical protein